MAEEPNSPRHREYVPFQISGDPSRVFRRSPGGLWRPEPVETKKSTVDFGFFIRVYVSHSDVYGGQPTWDDAVERLRQYDLGTILNVLGQISSATCNAEGEDLLKAQVGLVQWIFDERPEPVLAAGEDMLREAIEAGARTPTPVVFFHEQQLINAAKIALLEVPPDRPSKAETGDDLGDALLIVNDLVGSAGTVNRPPSDPTTEADRRQWERFFIVNGHFHHEGHPVPDLARTWDLYLTDCPHLRGSAVYQDLPVLVEEITGLSPRQLWARLFAVYSHWGKGPESNSGQLPDPLNLESHFTKNFQFTPEEEESFWPLVAGTPSQFRAELGAEGCRKEDLQPYNALPLEKRPLVRLGNQILCPSTLLMKRRMTTGLHHLFLNGIPEADHRERYLNYMGEVFEDYIRKLLEYQFGGAVGRLILEEEIEELAPEGSPVCDALVLYPEGVLLLEVKAKRLRLEARVRGDLKLLDEALEEIVVDAARQIDSVIRLIKVGGLTEVGVVPQQMRRFVPVSVTLDPIPMNPFTYDRLNSRLADENVLQQNTVLPLQLLAVEDLEVFELATASGENVLNLLIDRVEAGSHRYAGFLNYLLARKDSPVQGAHPRLRERFEALAEDAVDLFRERQS